MVRKRRSRKLSTGQAKCVRKLRRRGFSVKGARKVCKNLRIRRKRKTTRRRRKR